MMLNRRLLRTVQAVSRRLGDPTFWWLLIGFSAAALMLGALIVLAVGRHDSFLRLRPLICQEGITDWRFLFIGIVSPLWAVFALAAIGELFEQIDRYRKGHRRNWFYFGVFSALMLSLGVGLLISLDC